MLSPLATLACSAAVSSSYVASIYLVPSTRTRTRTDAHPRAVTPPQDIAASAPADPPRDRNHPAVIRARLAAVSLASLASAAALPAVLQRAHPALFPTYRSAVLRATALLGLALPPSARHLARVVLYPLALTASLFLGSVYVAYLDGDLPGQPGARTWAHWKRKFDGWKGVRNYLAVRVPVRALCPRLKLSADWLSGCRPR